MGVPGVITWLLNKDINLMKKNIMNVDYFLIDTNCLIHPQARIVCNENKNLITTDIRLLEEKIIKQIINYIEILINIIQPKNTIYIAVDGVPPMAKIKHQRSRRFKTIYTNKMLELLANKNNKSYEPEWNTSAISPGTLFMDKLMKWIYSWIENKKFNCKIIFSSSYINGEGEHKLLQYLKNNNLSKNNIVIYGLDSDLLFLSLTLNKNNIYLMRENQNFTMTNKCFDYLSIDILKNIIISEMNSRTKFDNNNNVNIINDFVFLCYFCGNDFIPYMPSLNLKPYNKNIINGIDSLLNAYCNSINNEFLLNNNRINQNLLIKILNILSENENEYFLSMYTKGRFIQKSNISSSYELDKYNFDNNIIENYLDPINLGNPKYTLEEYKYNYYLHYYNIDTKIYNINYIFDEYLKGLIWTNYYYYDKCKDYEWFFPFHHGPFISDFRNYIINNLNRISYHELNYSYNKPFFENQLNPFQQLLLILPYESNYLLPNSYKNILFSNELKKYFTENILDIKSDYLYKNKEWLNILMIDIIHPRLIKKLTKNMYMLQNCLFQLYIKEK